MDVEIKHADGDLYIGHEPSHYNTPVRINKLLRFLKVFIFVIDIYMNWAHPHTP